MIPFAPAPRSTFKPPQPALAPHLRPSSPIAPAFEPLSPPRRPTELAFGRAAVNTQQLKQYEPSRFSLAGAGAAAEVASMVPAKTRAPHARKHHRTPSTISDLADAALQTPHPAAYVHPQAPPHQSHPNHKSRKASSIGHQPPYSPPQYPMPPVSHSPHAHGEPAAKRARSEVGPSPHSHPFSTRPSTGHMHSNSLGRPHNVEQNIDRARRQSTNAIPSEDAELLLNFASRVQPRPAQVPSPVREFSARPPPALAPSVLSPPTLPATAASAPAAELVQGSQHDPSASLPSPQGTTSNDEEKNSEGDKAVTVSPPGAHSRRDTGASTAALRLQDQHGTLVSMQIRTPPEEDATDRSASCALALDSGNGDTDKARQHSQVDSLSADTAGETDSPKSRPRRGWPKGKPRGPRNKSGATKPRSTARRSRASTKTNTDNGSTTSGDDGSYPIEIRRKSETDLTALLASGTHTDAHRRHASVPPHIRYEILPPRPKSAAQRRASKKIADDIICSGCSQTRESSHGELDQWIGCNGCKGWFHYDCAGFKNERDVRDVDKYFCKSCEPEHGATTYVRKSSRTHTNVDYAGLNQGILKTSDEDPEHHYIQPIKDGTYTFDPESFPRMRPELVTAEYFQTCSSFTEPILIPAAWNPKRRPDLRPNADAEMSEANAPGVDATFKSAEEEELLTKEMEYETTFDDGQDKLGMVIPQGLTVRHVANIVGPEEPLEVIDVKTQGTEGKWNLAKFADYYESEGEKPVRNVISLEVSHTKLGKLLQRPKVVRQIDLQDSVWPAEEAAKGNYPKVQFYCLMSVADSFTDFHIDFGGSSVYYHILRGRKTFFFIPPKPSHLKAYEDWNNSPEQNFTWLPTKTKECYRVDLYEGDTMLIPSGWIHAVWTPTNSLVIGGNFLTRLHYSTQFRIVDIEKANKTPLKFRYPQFQKVMWYTVIKYLETDPLPADVAQAFNQGAQYHRERPVWQDFFDEASQTGRVPGTPDYNARYYSQAELDGLPELVNFIFRTVMISLGRIEGVSEETRKKVVRSIPKSHGDPLDVAKAFALWVAWKRGDEDPPAWAHPEADLPDKEAAEPKKLSARALKQLQRQEAINAYRVAPDRQSARQQATREAMSVVATSPAPDVQYQQAEGPPSLAQYTSTPKTSVLGPKRVACDACRKRRIRCKHKEQVTQTSPAPMSVLPPTDPSFGVYHGQPFQQTPESHHFIGFMDDSPVTTKVEPVSHSMGVAPPAPMTVPDGNGPALVPGNALLADPSSKRGRSKACFDCRKSKRRCVHDENGKLDPVKAEQTPVPRGSAAKKRKISDSVDSPTVRKSKQQYPLQTEFGLSGQTAPTMPYPMSTGYQQGMAATSQFQQHGPYPEQPAQAQWQQSPYVYPDPMGNDTVVTGNGPYHQAGDGHMPYNQSSLEQLANDVLDSRYVNNDEDGGYTVPQNSASSGAVQPVAYPPQQPAPQIFPQSHHSSDSGVAFSNDSQQAMGGPVQESKPAMAATAEVQRVAHDQAVTDNNTNVVPGPMTASNGNGVEYVDHHIHTPKDMLPRSQVSKDDIIVQPSNNQGEATAVVSADQHISHPAAANPNAGSATKTSESSPRTTKSGISNIPLYEPPPMSHRRLSRSSQPVEQPNGGQRSGSKTPAPMGPPELQKTPVSARKRANDSHTPVSGAKKLKFDEHIDYKKGAASMQDEESLKLAKALQDQEWGLRRRSREAI